MECSYCGRVIANKGALKAHEMCCKFNPARIKHAHGSGGLKKGSRAWNKGLTKETDERVKRNSESLKEGFRSGRWVPSSKGRRVSEETRKKLSVAAIKNGLGGCRYSHQFEYKGVILDSSFELSLAQDLDKNCIDWERPGPLKWKDEKGVLHRYYPDFYLPNYNIYLDPKNDYLIDHINEFYGISDRDRYNFVEKQNNVKILILRKTECNWKSIQEKLAPKVLTDARVASNH